MQHIYVHCTVNCSTDASNTVTCIITRALTPIDGMVESYRANDTINLVNVPFLSVVQQSGTLFQVVNFK